MIPIITAITSDHGTAVISFVAAGTNPDLISPFISNLENSDEKHYEHTAHKKKVSTDTLQNEM